MRPLRTYRATALVLRSRNLGEADRLLTIFSAERGKFPAVAKGARRPRSKLAALQLFSLATLQLAVGKNLDLITQADVHFPYAAIRDDLSRFAYASYFAELVDLFTESGEPNRRLFELLASAFSLLAEATDNELAARAFEITLLDLSGYAPELEVCVSCAAALGEEPMAFSSALGGLLCRRCMQSHQGLLRISEASRQTLLELRRRPRLTELRVAKLSLSSAAAAEIQHLLRAQIAYHIDRKINSLSLIERLKKTEDSS